MLRTRLGDYEVVRELGAGSMGTVYLAKGPHGPAAVKVIHPHLLATPGFFKRFLREAELGRKVTHPNVVRTLDVDATLVDDKQVNYMVMEYVEGKSLRDLLDELGTVPEALLREIAVQTAAGLAAIHAGDIVHRDLKPENILITDENEVRIMDLGVAKLMEASVALTKQGEFAGTLAYSAPEAFRGEPVGPPADQYAFGVILHELATGANPFSYETPSEVLAAHLQHEPARIDAGLLAEVIATLLAKQPAERFDSVVALREILVDGEASPWWQQRGPTIEHRDQPKIVVHRDTELYGRADDLQRLRESFALATAGQGNTVFIEGEAGIGKTRLVDAFVAKLQDAHVLYGCYPPTGGVGGLSDAVVGKFGAAGLEGAVRPYLADTPTLVPAFAALIRHEPTAAPLHGDALHSVCVQLMRRLAAERPTVWIVDDLQFADKESRDLVLSLARATEGHRALLLVTSRPGLPEEELAHLNRIESLRRLDIGRLSPDEIHDLLVDAFKSESLADTLGGRMARKSDGVPFFVFEMIRGLKESRLLEQTTNGDWVQAQTVDDIAMPSAVKDLIKARMRGLSDDERAILDVGAVQGMTFDPALVATVLERKKIGVLRDVAALEREHGLVRGEDRHIRFDHNQIQEVLYANQLPDLRREYHALLAEAYEGDDPTFLALHHLKGSRPRQGLPHVDPALDWLLAAYRNEAAFELIDLALAHVDDVARVELLLRKSARLRLVGRLEEAGAAAVEAYELAQDDVLAARSLGARAAVLITAADLDEAEAFANRRLELARRSGNKREEANATVQLGSIIGTGRRLYADALPQFEKALALYTGLDDADGRAFAENGLGLCYERTGRHEDALACHARVLALARATGDRNREAGTLVNTGIAHFTAGRLDRAKEHYEQARAILREIGNRSWEANAIGNIADVYRDTGNLAKCIELNLRYVDLKSDVGARGGVCTGQLSLAELYAAVGQTERAREYALRASALAKELSQPWLRRWQFVQGTIFDDKDLLRESDSLQALLELARRGDDEALARAATIDDPLAHVMVPALRGDADATRSAIAEHGAKVGVLACMEAHHRIGDVAKAHELLEHLREYAPEECRDAMIANVPLHRQIQATQPL